MCCKVHYNRNAFLTISDISVAFISIYFSYVLIIAPLSSSSCDNVEEQLVGLHFVNP